MNEQTTESKLDKKIRKELSDLDPQFSDFLVKRCKNKEWLLKVLKELNLVEKTFLREFAIKNGNNLMILLDCDVRTIKTIAKYDVNFIRYIFSLGDMRALNILKEVTPYKINSFTQIGLEPITIYKILLNFKAENLFRLQSNQYNNSAFINRFKSDDNKFVDYLCGFITKFIHTGSAAITGFFYEYLQHSKKTDITVIGEHLTFYPIFAYLSGEDIGQLRRDVDKVFFWACVNVNGKFPIRTINELTNAMYTTNTAQEYIEYCNKNGKLESNFDEKEVQYKKVTLKVPNYYGKITLLLPSASDKFGTFMFLNSTEGHVYFEDYEGNEYKLDPAIWGEMLSSIVNQRKSVRFPKIATLQLNRIISVTPSQMNRILNDNSFKNSVYVSEDCSKYVRYKDGNLYLVNIKKLFEQFDNLSKYDNEDDYDDYNNSRNSTNIILKLVNDGKLRTNKDASTMIYDIFNEKRTEPINKYLLTDNCETAVCGVINNSIFAYTSNK